MLKRNHKLRYISIVLTSILTLVSENNATSKTMIDMYVSIHHFPSYALCNT